MKPDAVCKFCGAPAVCRVVYRFALELDAFSSRARYEEVGDDACEACWRRLGGPRVSGPALPRRGGNLTDGAGI